MTHQCDIDPTKPCPSKLSYRVHGAGIPGVESKELLKCCKVQKQLEALGRLKIKIENNNV